MLSLSASYLRGCGGELRARCAHTCAFAQQQGLRLGAPSAKRHLLSRASATCVRETHTPKALSSQVSAGPSIAVDTRHLGEPLPSHGKLFSSSLLPTHTPCGQSPHLMWATVGHQGVLVPHLVRVPRREARRPARCIPVRQRPQRGGDGVGVGRLWLRGSGPRQQATCP